MEDSSILNIQWGSFESSTPITLDAGLEIETTTSSSINQPHDASKGQIGANDITFPNVSTCSREHPLGFQEHELVEKVQNTDVATKSKGSKTPIEEIQNETPSAHSAIKNKESKSTSYAWNFGSTSGWENADPPEMEIVSVLKNGVLGSATNMHQGGTIIEDSKGAKSKKANNMAKEEDKIVATTIQRSINPINIIENEVFARPNVPDVIVEGSKEEGDQKIVDLKHDSKVMEMAKAKDQEERLLLKAKRKERKKEKKTSKKATQMIDFGEVSNHFDSICGVASKEIGYEGKELVVEQTKGISSHQEQGVINSQTKLEEATMGIPSSSTLERTMRKSFATETPSPNTLVLSCNVVFIGVVLSIFIYIVVKFVGIP